MRLASLAASLVLVLASAATAEPHLVDLQVALDGRDVRLSFALAEAFDAELSERIQAGLPSGFIYRFRLYRDHQRWFDGDLGVAKLEVVAMYNAVTDEYLVNTKLDDELITSESVHDPAQLERALTRFAGLHVFTLDPDVPSDWRLLVRVRAELAAHTRFLFVPTTVATPWERTRKFRAPRVP